MLRNVLGLIENFNIIPKNKGRKHRALIGSDGMNCKGWLTHITRPITSMSSKGRAGLFSSDSAKFDKKKWSKRVRGYFKAELKNLID